MKVGQLVKINETGHAKWGDSDSNPRATIGKITEVSERWVCVDWSNGNHNSYHFGDLTVIETEAEKPQTVTGEAVGKSADLSKAKTIYAVYDGAELIYLTPDREDARGLKADLGGKRDGVIILAYGQAKEIR